MDICLCLIIQKMLMVGCICLTNIYIYIYYLQKIEYILKLNLLHKKYTIMHALTRVLLHTICFHGKKKKVAAGGGGSSNSMRLVVLSAKSQLRMCILPVAVLAFACRLVSLWTSSHLLSPQ